MNNNTLNELVVIKIGTSTLTLSGAADRLSLDESSFKEISRQVHQLIDDGVAVAIVSSGAIAAGYAYSHDKRTAGSNKDTLEKQRMACLGQATLMQAWQAALKPRLAGQVLFTRHELNQRSEGAELQRVVSRLFKRGDIPVANENDALAHDEITFGDNDALAAHFTVLLHESGRFRRSRLVILSDIDGLYEDRTNSSTLISMVNRLADYAHLAGGAGSVGGTGGMISKFKAAHIATQNGIAVYLANGRTRGAVQKALDGQIGTRFSAHP